MNVDCVGFGYKAVLDSVASCLATLDISLDSDTHTHRVVAVCL